MESQLNQTRVKWVILRPKFVENCRKNGKSNRKWHFNAQIIDVINRAPFDKSPVASEEVKFVIPSAAKPSEILFIIYKNMAGSNVDKNAMWSCAKHSRSKKYDCDSFGYTWNGIQSVYKRFFDLLPISIEYSPINLSVEWSKWAWSSHQERCPAFHRHTICKHQNSHSSQIKLLWAL